MSELINDGACVASVMFFHGYNLGSRKMLQHCGSDRRWLVKKAYHIDRLIIVLPSDNKNVVHAALPK